MTLIRRENFGWLGVKVGILFSRLPLGPNGWTLLSLFPAVLTFYFTISGNFTMAAFFFTIAAFADVVDGAVARVTGRVTRKGAYLDTVVDRYVEFLALFGLLFILPIFWVVLALFGSLMTTYSKAAAAEKLELEVKGGLMGRVERLMLLLLILISLNFSSVLALYPLAILALLSNISALQRTGSALKLA